MKYVVRFVSTGKVLCVTSDYQKALNQKIWLGNRVEIIETL